MYVNFENLLNKKFAEHYRDIARYQIRYSGKRWVLLNDLYDEKEGDYPLVFIVYEHAVYSMNMLVKEWINAGLSVPILEIVGFDYSGKECVLKVYGGI